jgi:uncharacterized protein (DUF2252 family)
MSDVPGEGHLRFGTTVHHSTVDERLRHGKLARQRVPRSRHGEFAPAADRPDPVTLLEEQAATRVPDLVPIRYGRMLNSPFAFYRGAARIMACDLAATPNSGLHAQLCGDAHLSNFGMFASTDRRLVFGANDFDETLPGPWEWDVKRLAASVAVSGRENGLTLKQRTTAVRRTAASYRRAMREFATMTNLAVWYARQEVDTTFDALRSQLDAKRVRLLERNIAKTRTRDSMHEFSRLTETVDGKLRIISAPPLIQPARDILHGEPGEAAWAQLRQIIRGYRDSLQSDRRLLLEQFRFVDIAFKVVGVGSVGTRAWIVLLMGKDGDDPLFLQFKEAQASVLEEYLQPSEYSCHSQRVVAGQHLIQASSDIFLGWLHAQSNLDGQHRDFYGRQLKDWKGSIEVDTLAVDGLAMYAELCGWTLARAHARSGDRIAIASYLGTGDVFDQAIAEFSEAYADQNERDYHALQQAVEGGRITALTGL